MVFIYVLQLENNKYYIGKAFDHKKTLEDHYKIKINWIKKYKPINIIEVIPIMDDLDEDKYTIKYMKEKGINNVRGGSFSEIILDDRYINVIKKFIHETYNKCYICGDDHFTKDCKPIYTKCYCIASYLSPHNVNNCLLKPININKLYDCEDDIIEKLKDINEYKNINEYKEYYTEKDLFNQQLCNKKYNLCKRCGRDDHKNNCIHTKHINGTLL
jgi:predicted GIY-YIG superfamily endonuclease